MLPLMSNNVLNIFCDASITKRVSETIGCPGSIVVTNSPSIREVDGDLLILRNSTNNHSEISAIFMAILNANKYGHLFKEVNIFSDSKISVFGLREWIFNWVNNTVNNIMYSSSGTPVANQQQFIRIIYFIVQNSLKLRFYHQSGHVNIGNSKSLENAKRIFLSSNNIFLTDEETIYISNFNNSIDQKTRQYLMSTDIESVQALYNPCIYEIPNQYTMMEYKRLIS